MGARIIIRGSKLIRPSFKLGQKRYGIDRTGAALLKLIDELLGQQKVATSTTWMLPYRDRIRAFRNHNQHAWLTYIATQSQHSGQRRLAIWLRGQCGGMLGTYAIYELFRHVDPQTQRTIVKTLRRLQGWAQLSEIERSTSDPRIRVMATEKPRPDREARIPNFLKNVQSHEFEHQTPEFVMADDLDLAGGRLPKPLSMIREILHRIHQLVHGVSAPHVELSPSFLDDRNGQS